MRKASKKQAPSSRYLKQAKQVAPSKVEFWLCVSCLSSFKSEALLDKHLDAKEKAAIAYFAMKGAHR